MMTRRQRLMATLRGEPVDRPAVNFYEIGGFDVNPDDPDELNVYNDPSWRPLLDLAEQHTDLIRMRSARMTPAPHNPRGELFRTEQYVQGRSRFTRTTLRIAGRTMTSLHRRDPDLHTTWTLEHLLKDADDLRAYLQLPDEVFAADPDVSNLQAAEEEVGERGIVMVDTGDPICIAADLFSMADYTVVALTEQELFHRLLAKLARPLHEKTEKVARAFPGRLWRICGPEYAAEPYLPPRLFREYVAAYPAARTAREKMLLIDRLLHGFHWYYKDNSPTRPVAVNLIEGRLGDVIAFLDSLTYGEHSTPGTKENCDVWNERVETARSWSRVVEGGE